MFRGLAKLLPKGFKSNIRDLQAKILDTYAVKSYSQEGEDMTLRRVFEGRERGLYVDVGAHHPHRFSNTYYFYRRGWHGINIEPNPDVIRAFQFARRRDTNLSIGVSDRAGFLTYYMFDDPALNTFDRGIVDSRLATTPYKVVKSMNIPVNRLDAILGKNLPLGRGIDFLSIDVEGLDLRVLQSNDWTLFRPTYLLVEALELSLEHALRGDIVQFMKSQGYELLAKTLNTLIFRDKSRDAATLEQHPSG
jgi:FkbM family methyltransferase